MDFILEYLILIYDYLWRFIWEEFFWLPLVVIVCWFGAWSINKFFEKSITQLLKRHKNNPVSTLVCAVGGSAPSCAPVATAATMFIGGLISLKALAAISIATLGDSGAILWGFWYKGDVELSFILSLQGGLIVLGLVAACVIESFSGLISPISMRVGSFVGRVFGSRHCHNCCHADVWEDLWHQIIELRKVLWVLFIVLFLSTASIDILKHFKVFDLEKFLKLSALGPESTIVGSMIAVFIGAFLGLIPGCSVSIVMIGLWSQGIVPSIMLVTLLISQDGDGSVILLRSNAFEAANIKILMFVLSIISGSLLVMYKLFI